MIARILMWGTDVLLADERPTGVNMLRKVEYVALKVKPEDLVASWMLAIGEA